ncbi:hypothetical protein [Bacillus weihaiensis]|uniref:hypothetical protein n=1 Tax=Bacillus weihaiensis TaxID=1547283 RepID=UPI0023542CFB|nr:hypothetical protein [Bacillus weihaiensis]
MNETQGQVLVTILKDEDRIVEKFEAAFQSVVDKFIDSTPIKVTKMDFIRVENDTISVRFAFTPFALEYSLGEGKRGSSRHSAETGRALFEFWAKFTVLSFFEDSLKVESQYTDISLLNKMTTITI